MRLMDVHERDKRTYPLDGDRMTTSGIDQQKSGGQDHETEHLPSSLSSYPSSSPRFPAFLAFPSLHSSHHFFCLSSSLAINYRSTSTTYDHIVSAAVQSRLQPESSATMHRPCKMLERAQEEGEGRVITSFARKGAKYRG